jgi:hypothetical protein
MLYDTSKKIAKKSLPQSYSENRLWQVQFLKT